ncbi:HAMP domain-containing histidine kinase [Thalassotalea litorea]|uniref:histidine kinase n=1 Tax=Thalassotalea litorea TaxID=2020715 RepID=A0A5R9IFR0_9GAMM|nr:HAMP domain-containing sensor histidine kinase [Thalassotalea litorea]TLU61018.1 HAMP domain-containing histidine kinase [Thalassotalea litorea]
MSFRLSGIKQQTLLIMVSFAIGLTVLYLGLSIITAFIVEDTMISKVMKRQAQNISQQYNLNGTLPPLDESIFTLYTDEQSMPKWLQHAVKKQSDDQEIFTEDNHHYHYMAIYLSEESKGYLIAEVSSWLVVSNQPKVFLIYIVGLVIALLIAIFLAFHLTRYIVSPVLMLTRAVEEKQSIESNARMPHLKHELGYLSDSMQMSFDRLDQALLREQNFTKDVSHELRTPLTVLTNTATLMAQRGCKQQDIEDIHTATQKLSQLVEQLFVLARGESHESQRCLVKPMIEQALLSLLETDIGEWDIRLTIDDQQYLQAPSALLNILIRNLIENVFRHASAKRIDIVWHQQTLTIANPIVESLPDNLTHSQVKSTASNGLGQGLFLVQRICQQCHWQLTTTMTEGCRKQFMIAIDFSNQY